MSNPEITSIIPESLVPQEGTTRSNDEIVQLFTVDALQNIPEKLKTHPVETKQMSPHYPMDYDIGIEIYEARVRIVGKVNLSHHEVGDSLDTPSAIAQAQELDISEYLEYDKTPVIGLIKPNKDAVGAAAVLALRLQDIDYDKNLVEAINLSDRYGPQAAESIPQVAKHRNQIILLDSICGTRSVSLEDKIVLTKAVLTGNYPASTIRPAVSHRDKLYAEAARNAQVQVIEQGELVYIKSTDRFAPEIGYNTGCPVVISYNEKFPVKGDENNTVTKYSISLRDEHIPCDMQMLQTNLNRLEQEKATEEQKPSGTLGTWGGRKTFLGSPEGENTLLSLEEIQREVVKAIESAKAMLEKEKNAELHLPDKYNFHLLNLREKEATLQWLKTVATMGVEVTDEDAARLCTLGNIDTQHGYGRYPNGTPIPTNLKRAAIESVEEFPRPEEGSAMATVRPDADSVGTMALANILTNDSPPAEETTISDLNLTVTIGEQTSSIDPAVLHESIAAIAKADQHGRGRWTGQKELPKEGSKPPAEEHSGVPTGLHKLMLDST